MLYVCRPELVLGSKTEPVLYLLIRSIYKCTVLDRFKQFEQILLYTGRNKKGLKKFDDVA